MKKNKIVEVLMERDGLSKEEATARKEEASEALYDALEDDDFLEAEEALADLGLELDYIFDLL